MNRATTTLALLILAAACGPMETDTMGTFDPTLAGATADFTDGSTTVPANFLEALEMRFEHVTDAANSVITDGDTCTIIEPDRTNPMGTKKDSVDITAVPLALAWDINGKFLVHVQNGDTDKLELRDQKTFALLSPTRELDLSFVAPIEQVVANERYVIALADSGAGTYKLDVFDLDDDSTVGTYTVIGAPDAIALELGRDHVFVFTDTGANGSVYAVTLSTATLDAAWATAGVYTRTYGPDGYHVCDDVRLVMSKDDDFEGVLTDDGSTEFDTAGLGTATGTAGLAMDGKGSIFADMGSYLARFSVSSIATQELVLENEVATTGTAVGTMFCDGEWVYRISVANITAHHREHLGKWKQGTIAATGWHYGNDLKTDGLRIYGVISTAGGGTVDGFAQAKGASQSKRMQRVDAGGFGALPFSSSIAPAD